MGARPGDPVDAQFTLRDCGDLELEVVGEDCTISVSGGVFTDHFEEYQVYIYRIPFAPASGS